LLTCFPLSAPSPVFFMASNSSSRAVHRSLVYLVCDVEVCRGRERVSASGQRGRRSTARFGVEFGEQKGDERGSKARTGELHSGPSKVHLL
jgi:hypothetical protein